MKHVQGDDYENELDNLSLIVLCGAQTVTDRWRYIYTASGKKPLFFGVPLQLNKPVRVGVSSRLLTSIWIEWQKI